MNKFKEQLKIIEEALLKPMSDERIKELDAEELKIKVDEIKKKSTLNADGSYDVEGTVDLSELHLTKLPMKFGKINGNFYCFANNLTTLDGAPTEVKLDFYCSYNNLTTLKGCPIYVGGKFSCKNNKLTSLEGAPKTVIGDFLCFENKIEFTKKDVRMICNVNGGIYV